MLLDCKHVEGFQNRKNGFGGRHFRIKDILYGVWATFDRSQPGYLEWNITKLGYMIFLVMGFISLYDVIWAIWLVDFSYCSSDCLNRVINHNTDTHVIYYEYKLITVGFVYLFILLYKHQ